MNRIKALAALPCGRRSKWVVLALWLVLLVAAAPLSAKLTDAQNNEVSSWLPAEAESTKVINEQKDFRPDTTVPAVVVYERASGLTPDDTKAIADDQAKFGTAKGVTNKVEDARFEPNNKAAQVLVPITIKDGGWNDLGDAVDEIKKSLKDNPDGLKSYVTGPAGLGADQAAAFEGIDGTLLYATLGVVVLILLFTYRSPVLWLLPVISAVAALFTAQAVVYMFTKAGLVVNGQSAAILTVLIFGAGTDYALLLIARYREELHRYEDRHEAMAAALFRAGPAIVASAATVGVGMLCLMAAEMQSTKGLGPVCALGVVVGLIAMTTLLPALLVIVGRWVFWPVRPAYEPDAITHDENGIWAKVGRQIARGPRLVWIVTAIILGVMTIGLTNLNGDGIANKDSFTDKPQSITGQEISERYFPAGSGDPIVVIGRESAATALMQKLQTTPGIAPDGVRRTGTANGRVQIEGVMSASPDSAAAKDTVKRVRTAMHAVPDGAAKVGGGTATQMDVAKASEHDDKVIIPLILLVVLIVLGLLLRAVIAPLVLIATVVLSFAAALGISVFTFEHLLGFKGTDVGFPLFVFVFLVALGIDYNVFLMSRVHEESKKHGTRRGVLIGLSATGGVITSAGLVLAATFAVLGTLPIVAFAEMGFTVALGVLLDTFIVRSVLVTALGLDIGRKIWWPSKLAQHPDEEEPKAGGDGDREGVLVG
ncbi:MMPL family transporter [Embleya scabrispora]|uniref:MMPL family transporter n=1 Tax=Embleya scabrispora TaxID=159449 RepID=UPI0003A732E0|nr:MMPL family transporter [Embleya scabrispora]MYS85639.1 MMPL family transporter [Streptomyces sp. SID5474]